MEFSERERNNMTFAERTEQIYESLKWVDRMTPGRTSWQTLRKRAERMAHDQMLEEGRRQILDAAES